MTGDRMARVRQAGRLLVVGAYDGVHWPRVVESHVDSAFPPGALLSGTVALRLPERAARPLTPAVRLDRCGSRVAAYVAALIGQSPCCRDLREHDGI